jgi:D-3-phosphoglycerate dehydrogenase
VELRGDAIEDMTRPVAAALLKGLLESFLADAVNYVNAPVLAEEHGIAISQSKGLSAADYANVISCRVHWDDGNRVIAGVLFGGRQPRIVQVSHHHLDADPTGPLLIMLNKDVPGVIGQVGTILGAYEVNIGEWRMGRNRPGEEALSFINLDSEPPSAALDALKKVPAITKLKFLDL